MFTKTRPRFLLAIFLLFTAIGAPSAGRAQPSSNTGKKVSVLPSQKVVLSDLGNHGVEAPAISNMVAEGIMKPVAVGIFNPDGVVTRGEFATMMQSLYKLGKPSGTVSFSDIKSTDPLFSAIQAMAPFMNRQVMCVGCALTTNFSPNAAISREEASIILVRIMGARNQLQPLTSQELSSFLQNTRDAKNWKPAAAPYFALAIKSGVMPLLGDNTFQPALKLTRADTAVLLDNINRQFIIPIKPPVLVQPK
jgi:S-layer homology domain